MKVFQKAAKMYGHFSQHIDESISPNLNFIQRIGVLVDYYKEKYIHGISVPDFFQYGFYWKNQKCRRTFICSKEMHRVFDVCNAKEHREIATDKNEFNKRCAEFVGRRWLNARSASYEEFCTFVKGLNRVFVKNNGGSGGHGAGIIQVDESVRIPEFYETCKSQDVILEEVIEQHEALARLNPSSVNTMRIVSLRDAQDDIRIMAAALRVGRAGKQVDNFHEHGICARIDVETGIVSSTGMDFEGKRYVVHPDSKEKITGFQIPNWNGILETVRNAAAAIPELRYVGWDMALNGKAVPVIVEGNAKPAADVLQAPGQNGLWPEYKTLIDELCKKGMSAEKK